MEKMKFIVLSLIGCCIFGAVVWKLATFSILAATMAIAVAVGALCYFTPEIKIAVKGFLK